MCKLGGRSSFCKKVNAQGQLVPDGYQYSLPTEAEWEYACRAGTSSVFHFGDSLSGRRPILKNYPYGDAEEECLETTTPVGKYPPNAWSLYDMHGNVWEWCHDWLGDYPAGRIALRIPFCVPQFKWLLPREPRWRLEPQRRRLVMSNTSPVLRLVPRRGDAPTTGTPGATAWARLTACASVL